jgi:hypothetical protein
MTNNFLVYIPSEFSKMDVSTYEAFKPFTHYIKNLVRNQWIAIRMTRKKQNSPFAKPNTHQELHIARPQHNSHFEKTYKMEVLTIEKLGPHTSLEVKKQLAWS